MYQDAADIYNNWYVIYVTTGKELYIKNTIQRYSNEPVRMTFFQREIIHTRRGKKVRVVGALFSGYIFIHEKIEEVLLLSKRFLPSERITPVSISNKPCMVLREEMAVLINSADSRGLFRLSGVRKVNDQVLFTYGALKNFQGKILWIDEKKNKAKVEIDLFRRKIKVNLGIEIINSASLLPCA
jgi:transcriptional antiterminator NusG